VPPEISDGLEMDYQNLTLSNPYECSTFTKQDEFRTKLVPHFYLLRRVVSASARGLGMESWAPIRDKLVGHLVYVDHGKMEGEASWQSCMDRGM
jgi:hypothetical protein